MRPLIFQKQQKYYHFTKHIDKGMIKKIAFAILIFGFPVLHTNAAPRTHAQMQQLAFKAINQQLSTKRMAPRTAQPTTLKQTDTYAIIGYEQGGFAVVSADDVAPEILGVSTQPYSHGENTNFQWWLQTMDACVSYAVKNGIIMKTTKPDPTKYPTAVEPMLTTEWGQQDPYNRLCPTFSGSTKCLTGCVATAMAQVLNYHKSPEHGYGQRTIYYPYRNYSGEAVTANFSEDYYDWSHMRDTYTYNFTNEEAQAVALLMRDCGVAADMEYGGPSEGSGAYSQDAAEGLRKYFGYEDAECLERDYYNESNWMDMVYHELSENGPMYYGGADASGSGGHAFVLHGYREDGKVYVNWGWLGDDDGYYDIALLNPDYYEFSRGQDMIIGISGGAQGALRTETVSLEKAGDLQKAIEALEGEGLIGTLTVSGPLDNTDLYYLRWLAGRDSQGMPTEGQLRNVTMTNATLPNNTLPDSIFKNCTMLRKVKLPSTIERIGKEAFNGCDHLTTLHVPTRTVPALSGTAVFQGMPFGTTRLYVRSSMKTKYMQSALWKDFGEKNIQEVGTSVKVRNTIRRYGEENPSFTYTVSGDAITGVPELSCEATPQSPAGRYPITISRGTVEGEDIDFIDGYLVVQKVDASATVGSYTREQYAANPQFELVSYDGLINNDLVPAWIAEPVFYCEATEESPVGEYPITVESANAESYNLTFVPGVLTVTQATGIHNIMASRTQLLDVLYTLHGRRVVGKPQKGIYIAKGRKYVVTK